MNNKEIHNQLTQIFGYKTTFTEPELDSRLSGTFLVGAAHTNYDTLVKAFGEPTLIVEDGSKTDWEWYVEFDNKVFAYIHNWKNGDNFLGEGKGQPKSRIFEWQINSKNVDAKNLVKQALLGAAALSLREDE